MTKEKKNMEVIGIENKFKVSNLAKVWVMRAQGYEGGKRKSVCHCVAVQVTLTPSLPSVLSTSVHSAIRRMSRNQ